MTDFQHSIVLFSGEDGLPLEFNIRNTNGKSHLKALIEHGGGLCSQSDNAVHLISPATKVLNADLGKKLVSSQYIFDCVKENYLLDVNDYVFTISEARTSDISDEESENVIKSKMKEVQNAYVGDNMEVVDMDIDETLLSSFPVTHKNSNSIVSSCIKQNEVQQNLTSSNTSESFVEGSVGMDSNFKISSLPSKNAFSPEYRPLTSTAKDAFSENIEKKFGFNSDKLSPIKISQSPVSPVKTNHLHSNDFKIMCQLQKVNFVECPENSSPVHTVVSSSQPTTELDEFDNILLSKAQQKHQSDEEECLSQSYTVSSSADAQVGSKPNSEEIFAGRSAVPDSPTQNENIAKEHQSFLKELETEVQKVLQKPSPKSIQDKICLVKYLCCVMKLPVAKVLELLPCL